MCRNALRKKRFPLGFSVPDLNIVVSQFYWDHTQQQRSVYRAQLVTEDPGTTHLPIDLTLTPAMPSASIPHTLKHSEQERVNLHSRCSRVERGPKMTRMDGGVLPYINSIHEQEILKLLWVRTEQVVGNRGTCSNNQQSHQKIPHHIYRH